MSECVNDILFLCSWRRLGGGCPGPAVKGCAALCFSCRQLANHCRATSVSVRSRAREEYPWPALADWERASEILPWLPSPRGTEQTQTKVHRQAVCRRRCH